MAPRKVFAETTNKKRKSDAFDALFPPAKRARSVEHANAKSLVDDILEDPEGFELPESDLEARQTLTDLANYVESLQDELEDSANEKPANQSVKKAMSPEKLQAAADTLRNACKRGIIKQMNWTPSCKKDSAKWTYDGVCTDPDIFARMMGLDKPPTWKQKKIPRDEFVDLMGGISASPGYSKLCITGKGVNVRWNPISGEFKFSGTYGRGLSL